MNTDKATFYVYSREATSEKKSNRLHDKFISLVRELQEKYCLIEQRPIKSRRMQFDFLHPTLPATFIFVRFEVYTKRKESHFFKSRYLKLKKTTEIRLIIMSFPGDFEDTFIEDILDRYDLQRAELSHYQACVVNQVHFQPLEM